VTAITTVTAIDIPEKELQIRYLNLADVAGLLPSLGEQMALSERALVAAARGEGDMPPKIGLHLCGEAFLNAMPAAVLSPHATVGMKWVSGFPTNAERGLPYIMGLIVLNDAETGAPLCIMDAVAITAVRTAAVTGVFLKYLLAPWAANAFVLGAGVQARAHIPILAALMPGVRVWVGDAVTERAARLAEWAQSQDGIGSCVPVQLGSAEAERALKQSDVVLTAGTTIGRCQGLITPEGLGERALVIALDWNTLVPGSVMEGADLFVVDDRRQYEYQKGLRQDFSDYPETGPAVGELIDAGFSRGTDDAIGRITAMPLGIAAVDVLFAECINRKAADVDAGTMLSLWGCE